MIFSNFVGTKTLLGKAFVQCAEGRLHTEMLTLSRWLLSVNFAEVAGKFVSARQRTTCTSQHLEGEIYPQNAPPLFCHVEISNCKSPKVFAAAKERKCSSAKLLQT